MHKKFDSAAIEKGWQTKWKESEIYKTTEDLAKPKVFVLDMFPYPSGEGLHVGHPKGYIATDIYSRFKRMTGHSVLHPMGWDAFGLPAENYAIKHQVHPQVAVEKNVARFKEQLELLGFDYDWDREINTTDPSYYKWTQWIFLQLFKKGLAVESYEPINWCPGCQTGLANEDLESDGTCERCGSVVEKRPMRQWVLKIRQYADRMLADLDTLNWPEHIKEAQRNWIGRSEGAEIDFLIKVEGENESQNSTVNRTICVFTTRPDTLYGATYLVLAPEHPFVAQNEANISNYDEVTTFVEATMKKAEKDRLDDTKDKTGVKLEGLMAINPGSGEAIPVYIADYVLGGYGTGAIMAVPAHDERDFAFAKKFGITIKHVVAFLNTPTGADAPREAVETKPLKSFVDIIIEHPTTGQFLLQRERDGGRDLVHFVGGGNDFDDDFVAVERELKEETGFTDFEFVSRDTILMTQSTAYRHTKGYNQQGVASYYHVKLNTLNQIESEIDQGKHTVEWCNAEEVANIITWGHHKLAWNLLRSNQTYTGLGVIVNSAEFDGLSSAEAKTAIVKKVDGRMTSTYKLKDWVFSRQRYWGEPIPIVHCAKCGPVAVPEEQLPLVLPEVEHYEPAGDGQSPLATIEDWVNTTCPICNEPGKRETNTMPQWAGSSWYYLRYMDPKNNDNLVSKEKENYWAPVDVYVGGDHAVRHLIYARFWHKFLYDIGVVSTLEPFQRLEFLGFILAVDGRKMSKRWGNVINPDDIVRLVGADTLRVYEMFMGPFENTIAWSQDGLVGARRFLERVNGLHEHLIDKGVTESAELTRQLHLTIKKVADDIEGFKFNTAVSAMMIFLNVAEKVGLNQDSYSSFLRLLAPFAPHLTEELWHKLENHSSIHLESFPVAIQNLMQANQVTIGVQINGKVRGNITLKLNATEAEALIQATLDSQIGKYLTGKSPTKVIYVPGRILNLIIS